jgi:phospholipase C
MAGDHTLTRRRLLRGTAGAALAASPLASAGIALANHGDWWLRRPDSLPDPTRPAGEPTADLPFDHIVALMMENHSFDCYFGMLPRRGQPQADGFTFDSKGRPVNRNPYHSGFVYVQPAESECQASVTQNWNSSHRQINGGRMDGFAATAEQSMAYWTDEDLPFYYSLAKEFTLANRWFCSTPCQTYPNRRFYLCGTAFGLISTDTKRTAQDPPPPNGTIFDRLDAHGIGWKNYFVDVPGTAVIPSIVEKSPLNLAPIAEFYLDCATGALPPVSFVDPEIGLLGEVGGPLEKILPDSIKALGTTINAQGGSEENPQDIQVGESFAAGIVNAVLNSPAWDRTLFVWLYDEHGGYYDHVPPPRAVKPDDIPPRTKPTDAPGGYDLYGPRVPAVVVSPYSRPRSVCNTVVDHTSVLSTIEAKWNLPACTFRDANANTLAPFLQRKPKLLDPPELAAPAPVGPGEAHCRTDQPELPVHHRWPR